MNYMFHANQVYYKIIGDCDYDKKVIFGVQNGTDPNWSKV